MPEPRVYSDHQVQAMVGELNTEISRLRARNLELVASVAAAQELARAAASAPAEPPAEEYSAADLAAAAAAKANGGVQ